MLKALICMTLLTLPLAVLMPLAAHAADAGACEAYAKAAVAQVSIGRANPACAAGIQGARWSPAFRVHFVYCMTRPNYVVENQQGERTEYLRSCGAMR
jgi:hypothetical protein